jgi:hypothetical protein
MMRRLVGPRWSVPVVACVALIALAVGTGIVFLPHGQAAHASGSGEGGPCFVPTGSSPVCQFDGYFVTADYTVQDTSTCANGVFTSFSVYAADNVIQNPPGSPTGSPLASVYYSRYNGCTYEYDYGYGEILGANFSSTGNLGTASVHAAIPLSQYGNSSNVTITLSLNWTGVGTIGTTIDNRQLRMGDVTTITRFKGENRSAVVTGTVFDGTTTFNVAVTGDMNSTQTGTIQIMQS